MRFNIMDGFSRAFRVVMGRFVAVLLGLIAAAACVARGPDAEATAKARELNRDGVAAMRAGNPVAAVKRFEEATKLTPGEAEPWNNLGVARLATGESALAEAAFRKAVKGKPDMLSYRVNLSRALLELQRDKEAAEILSEVVKENPSSYDGWYLYGSSLTRDGKWKEAEQALGSAAALKSDPEAENALGVVLLNQKKFDQAESHFKRALKLDPKHAEAQFNLGVTYQTQSRFKEAVAAYNLVRVRNPSYVPTYYNIAVVLTRLGHVEEAKAALRIYLRLLPPTAERERADARERLKKLGAAVPGDQDSGATSENP